MTVLFSDEEIGRLVGEVKPLPENFKRVLEIRPKRGHNESKLTVEGVNGNEFVIMTRQSRSNALDFSLILGYQLPNTNRIFRLRRYNGKSHLHTNRIEGDTFYDFHVHEATERYQELGAKEESYATVSERFSTLDEAIACMFEDCGFEVPDDTQGRLFKGY